MVGGSVYKYFYYINTGDESFGWVFVAIGEESLEKNIFYAQEKKEGTMTERRMVIDHAMGLNSRKKWQNFILLPLFLRRVNACTEY